MEADRPEAVTDCAIEVAGVTTMSRVAYTPISDEELECVKQRTAERDRTEPRVDAVHYDAATGRLVLEMRGGAVVTAPARSLKSLRAATDAELADVRAVSNGSAVFWDALDVQATTVALLQLIFQIGPADEPAPLVQDAKRRAKAKALPATARSGGRRTQTSAPRKNAARARVKS